MEDVKKAIKEAKLKIKEQKEVPTIYTSFYDCQEFMLEQGYNNGKTYFIKWDKKTQTYENIEEIGIDGTIYRPIYGQELTKGAVILPTKPEEYGTDEELDQEIINHIHEWLDVPEEFERFTCYNIRLSWIYEKFNTLNYTRALGDTGTGKSRFLFTIGHLHYKPMLVAGALTPAVIFRFINKWKGTLLIDEGDQQASDESNAFIKIMNCGYEKGVIISRCDKNDPNKLDFFDVFCPKVLTTRRRFEDKATEARCMTTIMVQTFRNEIKDILTRDYFKSAEKLRNKLLMWKFKNYDIIDPEAGLKVDLSKYEPRLRQVNRSFISLFYNNKEQLANFLSHLDKYQQTIIEERASSFDGIILNMMAEMISNGWENITAGDIKEQLEQNNVKFQYPLTLKAVGKVIRGSGLEFYPKKVDGKTKKIIIQRKEVLENIFSRYVIDEYIKDGLVTKGYLVTQVTEVTQTGTEKTPSSNGAQNELRKNLSCHSNVGNYGNSVTNIIITKEEIKHHILGLGDGEMAIEQLKEDLEIDDEFVEKLLKNGDFFQPKPGIIKVL